MNEEDFDEIEYQREFEQARREWLVNRPVITAECYCGGRNKCSFCFEQAIDRADMTREEREI